MRSSSSSAAARHAPSRRNSPFRSVSERAEIGHRPGSAVRCAEAQRQLPGGGGRFPRTGCPRTCRGEGKRPAAVVWDECAPCAARHSERSGADCGKSLRGGRLFARDVPGTCRRAGEGPAAADAGGCEKTAGSRKIDENLIFGTRAFVFYPLSLAAPKILRLNKIANKFAFVSGLFVSLRLKPKYANRP